MADSDSSLTTSPIKNPLLNVNIANIINLLDSPDKSESVGSGCESSDTGECSDLLKDVVAYAEVKSQEDNRSRMIGRELIRLGARVEKRFTKSVTHVIFYNGSDKTRERAEKNSLFLVGVSWIHSCKQHNRRMPESDFPAVQSSAQIGTKRKKYRSMQPIPLEEELARSNERAKKKVIRENRWKILMEGEAYSDYSPSYLAKLKSDPHLVPDTPALTLGGTTGGVLQGRSKQMGTLLEEDEDVISSVEESPLPTTSALQKRLFDSDDSDNEGPPPLWERVKKFSRNPDRQPRLPDDSDLSGSELRFPRVGSSPESSPSNSPLKFDLASPGKSVRNPSNRKHDLLASMSAAYESTSDESVIGNLRRPASRRRSLGRKAVLNSAKKVLEQQQRVMEKDGSECEKLVASESDTDHHKLTKTTRRRSLKYNKPSSEDASLDSETDDIAAKEQKPSLNRPKPVSNTLELENESNMDKDSVAKKSVTKKSVTKQSRRKTVTGKLPSVPEATETLCDVNKSISGTSTSVSGASTSVSGDEVSKKRNLMTLGNDLLLIPSPSASPNIPRSRLKSKSYIASKGSKMDSALRSDSNGNKTPGPDALLTSNLSRTSLSSNDSSTKEDMTKSKSRRKSVAVCTPNKDKVTTNVCADAGDTGKKTTRRRSLAVGKSKSESTLVTENAELHKDVLKRARKSTSDVQTRKRKRSDEKESKSTTTTEEKQSPSVVKTTKRRKSEAVINLQTDELLSTEISSKKAKAADKVEADETAADKPRRSSARLSSEKSSPKETPSLKSTEKKGPKSNQLATTSSSTSAETTSDSNPEEEEMNMKSGKKRKNDDENETKTKKLTSRNPDGEKEKKKTKKNTSQKNVETGSGPTITLTNLHSDERGTVMTIIKKLGGYRITDRVDDSTTHVVCGEKRRTLNVLHAIARGCLLVGKEWVFDSLEKNRWVPEQPYLLDDDYPSSKTSRGEKTRLGADYLGARLFADCGGIMISQTTEPPPDELNSLIQLCSGQIVTSPRTAKISVGKHRKTVTSVTEKWVLDSITQLKCQPLDEYLIKHEAKS